MRSYGPQRSPIRFDSISVTLDIEIPLKLLEASLCELLVEIKLDGMRAANVCKCSQLEEKKRWILTCTGIQEALTLRDCCFPNIGRFFWISLGLWINNRLHICILSFSPGQFVSRSEMGAVLRILPSTVTRFFLMLRCKRWDPWCTMNIYELRNYVSYTPARSGPISLICVLDLFFSQLIVFSPWWICELNYRSGVYKTPTVTPQRWRLLGEFDKKAVHAAQIGIKDFQWVYLQGPGILNLLFHHIHCHLPFSKVIFCDCSGRIEAKDHVKYSKLPLFVWMWCSSCVKCVVFCSAITWPWFSIPSCRRPKDTKIWSTYIEIQYW